MRGADSGHLLAATVLAFFSLASYTITAAVAASLAAYTKFSAADKKLQRFSASICGIDSILLWWRSLDSEKQDRRVVSTLVARCEATFATERQSWVSTSLANKMLSSKADDEVDEERAQEGGAGKAKARHRGGQVAPEP